ncbi:hypothetical protein [Vibrio parahaemolyticus]|uniref:hypothetical protein n=1 Tax=Vibrio parahaemolyticus TaxID=670 RepID=UPI0011243786|nr:hypothetical protein [Vibrio parahaemolyticus]TOD58354.1 hypothetical protein CGJ61_23345 [Vibrio parahaemolyticus]
MASSQPINRVLGQLSDLASQGNPSNTFDAGADRISQSINDLRALAQEQTAVNQANYEAQKERNTANIIDQLNRATSQEALRGVDTNQFGNQVDQPAINQFFGSRQDTLIDRYRDEWTFDQEQQAAGADLASSKFVSSYAPSGNATTDMGKLNEFRLALNSDETLSPQAKVQAEQKYINRLQVENGLRPQWDEPKLESFGDSQVTTQRNAITGETKQIGAWSKPGVNGTGSSVFATDVQYRTPDGKIHQGSKGKDGRIYDRNGNAVQIGGNRGATELRPDMTNYHLDVVKNSEDFSPEQVAASREFLNAESLRESNRGQFTQEQFVNYVTETNASDADIQYLDDTLEVISLLQESDVSRLGSEARSTLNRFLELGGYHSGEADVNELFAQSESRKLEIVRGIVRAFAPVSDTAMNLVIDGLSGKTLAGQLQAVKATRDKVASEHNAKVKTASDLGVADKYRGTTYDRWTKPTYASKSEIKDKVNTNVGNQATAERGVDELRSLAANKSGTGTQTPPPATVVITNHPKFGSITEADIQETMSANNMSREQVMAQLGDY